MNVDPRADPNLSLDTVERVETICTIFEGHWRAGERPPIEDLLFGAAGLERTVLFRELLALELEYRLLAGERPTPTEYTKRFPTQLDVIDMAFRESQESGKPVCKEFGVTSKEIGGELSEPSTMPRVFGEYQLLSEIARGGMGVVYKARQLSLDRVVAVKMILTGHLASSVEVERFQVEAQAAAQLDHPGIVRIIEVGQRHDQHFFSMELVDGSSLARRLADGPLPPREATTLIAAVAAAVDYAHRHGVIHRDLKPANILIDIDGQPHITDFGLAKRISYVNELTATGQIIGTPSFMPPEQARGGGETTGAASDVYSLGAVFYMTLTGRPPFQAASVLETLKQVLEEEPVPPRRLDRAVPRDLEVITLKCLEKKPARRYVSAQALLDDLRRFLAGQPIHARPVGRGERLWQIAKRSPRVTALIAVVASSLLAVVAMSLFSAARIETERREATRQQHRAEASLRQVEAERARAAQNFAQARQAVDDLFLKVSEDHLFSSPGMQPLRMELLASANNYYHKFVEQERDNPGLRAELAASFHALALMNEQKGDHEAATRNCLEANHIRERLLNEHPQDSRYRFDLIQSVLMQGRLHRGAERHDLSLAAFRLAESLITPLVRKAPISSEYRRAEVDCAKWLGITHAALGRHAESLTWCKRASDLQERVVEANPNEPRALVELGETYVWVGCSHDSANHASSAAAAFRRAQAVLEHLTKVQPMFVSGHVELARCYDLLGTSEAQAVGRTAALVWFTKARDIRERLVRDNPSVTDLNSGLAQSYRNVGDHQQTAVEFLAWHERAQQLAEELANQHVGGRLQNRNLAAGYSDVAGVLRHISQLQHSLDKLQLSRTIWEQLLGDGIASPSVSENYAYALSAIAQCQLRLDQHDAYQATCDELVAHCRLRECRDRDYLAICTVIPTAVSDPAALTELAGQLARKGVAGPDRVVTYGAALHREGRDAEAIRVLLRADATYRIVVRARAEGSTSMASAGRARGALFLALAHRRLGKRAEAERWLNQARETMVASNVSSEPKIEYGLADPWPGELTMHDLVAFWDRAIALQMLASEADATMSNAASGQ